ASVDVLGLEVRENFGGEGHAVAARHRGIFNDGDLGRLGSQGEIGQIALLHQLVDGNLGRSTMLCEGVLRQGAERKAGAREKHAAGDDSATVEVEAEPALE